MGRYKSRRVTKNKHITKGAFGKCKPYVTFDEKETNHERCVRIRNEKREK